MAKPSNEDGRTHSSDPDGVRVVAGRRVATPRAVFALAAIALLAFVASRALDPPTRPHVDPEAASPEEPSNVAGGAAEQNGRDVQPQRFARLRAVRVPARPAAPTSGAVAGRPEAGAAGSEHASNENAQVDEIVRDLAEAAATVGEREGIAVYPRPGTDPVKVGLVVPEDFELPEGYMRHYQVTDDGRRMQPILMFSPDYEFVDASGQPVEIPEDGIVPPEMAPPGMPVRTLEVPPNPYGGGNAAN